MMNEKALRAKFSYIEGEIAVIAETISGQMRLFARSLDILLDEEDKMERELLFLGARAMAMDIASSLKKSIQDLVDRELTFVPGTTLEFAQTRKHDPEA